MVIILLNSPSDNSKDSLKYKLAVLLLREVKNPDDVLGIDDMGKYSRLLRSLEKVKGESEHEMRWRTEDYSIGEAEKWTRDSLREVFYLEMDLTNYQDKLDKLRISKNRA